MLDLDVVCYCLSLADPKGPFKIFSKTRKTLEKKFLGKPFEPPRKCPKTNRAQGLVLASSSALFTTCNKFLTVASTAKLPTAGQIIIDEAGTVPTAEAVSCASFLG